MNVSEAGAASLAVNEALSAEKPTKVDVAVARKALDTQKAEGEMVADMIKKAGSVVDVTA
ncbi:MAG: hypothetical protein ACNS63_12655 [Candidatus Nitrospinota bacterium M3_3B_026]